MSGKQEKALKPFPRFDTDEQAERFVDTADLSEYDFSSFRPTRFKFEPKARSDQHARPPPPSMH
jgi:hypothetical protein